MGRLALSSCISGLISKSKEEGLEVEVLRSKKGGRVFLSGISNKEEYFFSNGRSFVRFWSWYISKGEEEYSLEEAVIRSAFRWRGVSVEEGPGPCKPPVPRVSVSVISKFLASKGITLNAVSVGRRRKKYILTKVSKKEYLEGTEEYSLEALRRTFYNKNNKSCCLPNIVWASCGPIYVSPEEEAAWAEHARKLEEERAAAEEYSKKSLPLLWELAQEELSNFLSPWEEALWA